MIEPGKATLTVTAGAAANPSPATPHPSRSSLLCFSTSSFFFFLFLLPSFSPLLFPILALSFSNWRRLLSASPLSSSTPGSPLPLPLIILSCSEPPTPAASSLPRQPAPWASPGACEEGYKSASRLAPPFTPLCLDASSQPSMLTARKVA